MDELHRRLLDVGLTAGPDLGLVLAGGYALVAHDLVNAENGPVAGVDHVLDLRGGPPQGGDRPARPPHHRPGPRLRRRSRAKVRALHDRAAHRDFIDVHAAYTRYGWHDLEALAARHTAGFALEELADRLGAVDELERGTFAAYGLVETDINALIRWAAAWESDIRARLAAGETGPTGPPESEWDTYLDPESTP